MTTLPPEVRFRDQVEHSTDFARNRWSGLLARYHITGLNDRGYCLIKHEGAHQKIYPLTEAEWRINWDIVNDVQE